MNGTPNTGNSSPNPTTTKVCLRSLGEFPKSKDKTENIRRTLKQTYSQDFPRVTHAFKDSMTHEFCKSHYLSQFATFFIDVGAETSPATGCMSIESLYSQMIFHVGKLRFTTQLQCCPLPNPTATTTASTTFTTLDFPIHQAQTSYKRESVLSTNFPVHQANT